MLSGAHCYQYEYVKPESLYAVVGTVYPKGGGVKYRFDKVTVHEQFSPDTIYNDIALLRTAVRIAFTDRIQPIALATKDAPENIAAYVSGWGKIEVTGTFSDYMKYTETHTVSNQACYDYHKKIGKQHHIVKTSLCTYESNGDGACSGDSGKFNSFFLAAKISNVLH